jgi:L-iditol 2-dehydrogenase
MNSVVFPGDRTLEFLDVSDPTPGPSEVVLEIKASGMCGSDLTSCRASEGAISLNSHSSDELLAEVRAAFASQQERGAQQEHTA